MSDQQQKDQGPCTTCRGGYSEHFDAEGKPITQHPYTTGVSELSTQAERAKAAEKPSPPMVLSLPPSTSTGHPTITDRLVEILIDNELITSDQAVYIAGFSTKPERKISHGNGA